MPQVPPSLLKYPGGNGGLNPLLDPRQVAVLKQLSQFSQLSQLNQISQLQVKLWWRLRRTLVKDTFRNTTRHTHSLLKLVHHADHCLSVKPEVDTTVVGLKESGHDIFKKRT